MGKACRRKEKVVEEEGGNVRVLGICGRCYTLFMLIQLCTFMLVLSIGCFGGFLFFFCSLFLSMGVFFTCSLVCPLSLRLLCVY